MSAVTAMTADAPVQVRPAMARVNLLPPEIERGRRFRRVQTGLGGAVGFAVLLVVLGFLLAAIAVGHANTSLQNAQAEQSGVQKETSGYRGVSDVYTRTAAVQALLTQAMGKEVRYSALLTSMAESMPPNVVLNNLTFSESGRAPTGAAPAAGATASAATPTAAAAAGGIATVTMSGLASSHDDVAAWLEAVAKQKGYATPQLQSTTQALGNGKAIVNWSTTVPLTTAALSGRYTKVGG